MLLERQHLNSNKNICYIVGAGEFYDNKFITQDGDVLIAVDGGYDTLVELGIKNIDYLIGDLDSIKPSAQYNFANKIIKLPTNKDDTDMLYALKFALKIGYSKFRIYGAFGGRIDHLLANIQCLTFLSDKDVIMYGNQVKLTAIKNSSMAFDENNKGLISIFSLSNQSENVNIDGLKYEIHGKTLTNQFPIGVSNEFVGQKASISVKNGILLICF
jgi:thiamine pyrophosphokinase